MAKTVRVRVDEQSPIYQAGIDEGRRLGRKEALDFLQDRYIGPDAPARGSDNARALLDLARDLGEHLRSIK